MAKYDTVLWDWNGTLLDDVALCVELLNTLLTRHGHKPVKDTETYRGIFCFPIETYYTRAGFDFSVTPYAELAEEYMQLYGPKSLICPLQKDARRILETLQARGVHQVILSASEYEILCEHLRHHDLCGYFDTILGLRNIYARSKADLGRQWISESGTDPVRTVMVGDSVHDFEVARAIGVDCILFSGGHQQRRILEETGAPVIDTLSELPALTE